SGTACAGERARRAGLAECTARSVAAHDGSRDRTRRGGAAAVAGNVVCPWFPRGAGYELGYGIGSRPPHAVRCGLLLAARTGPELGGTLRADACARRRVHSALRRL